MATWKISKVFRLRSGPAQLTRKATELESLKGHSAGTIITMETRKITEDLGHGQIGANTATDSESYRVAIDTRKIIRP